MTLPNMNPETSPSGDVPANTPVQACPHCEALIDIADLDPLSRISCPGCEADITVRGIVAQFRLVEVAGKGGIGTVYRALDTQLDRAVALKLLRREASANEDLITQLETEAAIIASINHPHVTKLYSTGIDQGRFWIAMELADKGSLDHLIRSHGRIAEAQVLDIGIQIAKGLRAAHQHGVIHRDVKPGNILFSDSRTTKIVDFGLAKFKEQEEESVHSEIWGMPFYTAPEKLDDKPNDFRSDIYALGATLYHALAGRPPFETETASIEIVKRLKSQGVNLQSFAPWVSSKTASVINRTLNRNPDERYQSYDEMIEQLEHARAEIQKKTAQPETSPQRKVLQNAEGQKAMSWMTFAVIGIVAAAGFGAILFRDVLFKSNNRAISTLVTGSANANNPFRKAIAKLADGDGRAAAEAFQRIAETRPKQPDLNWVTLGEGLGELVAGRRKEAQLVFRRLSERGVFSSDPQNAALAAFFFHTGRRMSNDEPISADAEKQFDGTNHEAISPLLFGLKNWELGKIEEAAGFFRQFRLVAPSDHDAWIADLKPLATRYMEDFTKFQLALNEYRNANNATQKTTRAEELQRFPGPLGEHGKKLTASLEAELAQLLIAPPKPEIVKSPLASHTPTTGGTYRILNRNSGLALDVAGFKSEDGSPVQQHANLGRINQQWKLTASENGFFRLTAVHSEKALSVSAPSEGEGVPVVQTKPSDSDAQKWTIASTGNGYFKLVCKASGQVLSVKGASMTRGVDVTQAIDKNTPEQHWEFVVVGPAPIASTPQVMPVPSIISFGQPPSDFKTSVPVGTLTSVDIGNVVIPGSDSADTEKGTFTLKSASKDIWNFDDEFRFKYRKISGDFDAVVRVSAMDQPHEFAKAGLMLRFNLQANSPNAYLAISPVKGVSLQRRPTPSEKTLGARIYEPQPPQWLKLTRRGEVVSGQYSTDGTHWTPVYSDRLPGLPEDAYLGLAVSSHDAAKTCTATFENLQLRQAP